MSHAVSPADTVWFGACAGIEKPNVPGTPLALRAFATNVRERTETGTSESTRMPPAGMLNGAAWPANVVPRTSSTASVSPGPTVTRTFGAAPLSPVAEKAPSIGLWAR